MPVPVSRPACQSPVPVEVVRFSMVPADGVTGLCPASCAVNCTVVASQVTPVVLPLIP